MALMVTIWCDALVEVRLGDAERVGALADQMSSLRRQVRAGPGQNGLPLVPRFGGRAQGHTRESFRQIRAAYEENTALGMIAGGSETLGYAAEALVLHGDFDGAQEQLEQALEIVSRYGERIYLPQLLLIQGASHAPEASSRQPTPPSGAPSRKREHKRRRGWSCSRSPSSANADLRRPMTDTRSQHWSIGSAKQATQPRSRKRERSSGSSQLGPHRPQPVSTERRLFADPSAIGVR